MRPPKLFATTPAASPTVRLALARDVARGLLESLDPAELASTAVVHLRSLVLADAAAVVVWDGEDGARLLAGQELPLADGLGATALLGPPPVESAMFWLDEADEEPPGTELGRTLHRVDAKHAIVTPLVAQENLFGMLAVWRTRSWPFERDDLSATEEIAGPLSLALENARLHRDVAASLEKLQRTQSQLVRRERLAAVGTMAAVVAHEVRSPLAICVNAVGALRRGSAAEEDRSTLLAIMDEEMRRLEMLVDDLLDFGRPSHRSFRQVVAADVIGGAVDSVRQDPRVPAEVAVTVQADPTPKPQAFWDARGVHQLVVNLVLNGAHAIAGDQGRGTVGVSLARDGAAFAIEVTDDGPGIPEDVRDRIFEPFFTTRSTGTGLGLAVVRRVVDDHAGSVEVSAGEGGRGTCMRVRLPDGMTEGY